MDPSRIPAPFPTRALASLLTGVVAACGGTGPGPADRPRDPAVDQAYQAGLSEAQQEGRSPQEKQSLRRSFDLGFTAGSEEALAVNARSTDEMRRLGCRTIHPEVASVAERARRPPPSVQDLCPPPLEAERPGGGTGGGSPVAAGVDDADGEPAGGLPRHRGPLYRVARGDAVAIAESAGDRRLAILVLEAFETGYERGYRVHLEGWDRERSHRLELDGCRAAVERALSAEYVSVFDREPLLARCEALPSHGIGL